MNMIPAAKLVFDYVVAAFAPPAPFEIFAELREAKGCLIVDT